MDDNYKLAMLKVDLGITTTVFDKRLEQYLSKAKSEIEREGITLADSIDDDNLLIFYAAWLWRSRDNFTAMPRGLRYMMNNRLFSEKMSTDEEES
jgi:hypothetical protein